MVISIFHPPSSIRYLHGVRFRKITIIGVGLLGGSIGLAAKRRKLVAPGGVAGFVRRVASLKDCERAGAVDFATTDLLAAVWDADLVILCTPLAQMLPRVKEMLPALKRGAIITDVGSVKAGVVRELESLVAKAGAHFVGSHPMAGAEKTGVSAARRGVVRGRRLRRHAHGEIKPGGGSPGGTILGGAGRANPAAVARRARFAGQPVQPPAACPGVDFGWFRVESGTRETPGHAVRQRLPRHDAHCVGFAGNVA